MLGVTVLILVISVMTGFDRELRQKVIDFDAHILVSTEDVLRDWRTLKTKIDNTPDVVATAPYIQGPVIVEFQNRRVAPLIRGVDPAEEEKVIPLKKFIKYGKLDLEGDSTVLGIELARKLQVSVGDKITVYSPGNLGQVLDGIKKLENAKGEEEKKAIDQLRDVILPKELTVTGIFETGHYLHDSEYLLVPVYVGQELYGLGDALHGITVRTDNPYAAERVKQAIEQFLEPPQYAQTWIDMNHQFFEAVRLERSVMFFLLFFIVVVAAFGIMSTLITVTVQKRREIGIIVNNAKIVRSLITIFEDDWKASDVADPKAEKKRVSAHVERTSRTITKAVSRKLTPVPLVQEVVKTIEKEAKVEVDRREASEIVKGALRKAVKKAAAKIVAEAAAD